MRANVIVFEISTYVLFIAMYLGAARALGRVRNRDFLLGSGAFALVIYTVSVVGGVNNFYWYSTNSYYKHYPLGGYIIWVGVVPLAALLLFYVVSMASYLVASTFSNNVWKRSAIAGGIAVVFYLMIQPVAVTNHWWVWNAKTFYLLDVPLLAWIGVFLAVFAFTATYQLTVIEKADPAWLKPLEDRIKRLGRLKSKKATINLEHDKLAWVYAWRLVIALVAFGIAMIPVMLVLWAIANRGPIPPGW